MYQLNVRQQVVRFDKKNGLKGPIFTLLPADKNGDLQSPKTIKNANDIDMVDLMTITENGHLVEAREPENFIQVLCNSNGELLHDRDQSLKDLY